MLICMGLRWLNSIYFEQTFILGQAASWGYDSSGQLGLGLKDEDEKIVPRPEKISSAHLDGFKIVDVSLADNHALFVAAKI